jgi:aspartyl-tRNA(Asn)/glutamyl-tRNA(Gln) amidotransferase subunit B
VNWETVIGLEVHVQLATETKLFCGCAATFGAAPNTNVCPVCLGLPGALPVTNKQAVTLAVRAALALQCQVHETSVFARKNYFYPDLPKGYQISQFDRPLATAGVVRIASAERSDVEIGITRLHLEEDAGKLLHDRFEGFTAVDCNRAGVPLVEIVSEPDLRSPAEARSYLTALKQLLEYVGVSDCNMEEGHLRVDANLSIRPPGARELGTKQEVKNMNSFAAAERALEQLAELQRDMAERGDAIVMHTYSAATGSLRVMRGKEESHDYRYFPDPDLPPLIVSTTWREAEGAALPELPDARHHRFESDYDVTCQQADVLTATVAIGDYFEDVVRAGADPQASANWVMGPVLQDANERGDGRSFPVPPSQLAALIALVDAGTVSFQAAKRVFAALDDPSRAPREVAEELGLLQVGDRHQLARWIDDVMDAHADERDRWMAGEDKLTGFFMGQVMKASRGRANPKQVKELLEARRTS